MCPRKVPSPGKVPLLGSLARRRVMPTRARAEADAAAAAEGKVKQPRGRKPTGYQIWDGTPPGTWRNERGEAYQPGAPSHEVEAPMPAELVGVITRTGQFQEVSSIGAMEEGSRKVQKASTYVFCSVAVDA